MPLREGAAGAGLEVTLEASGDGRVRERQRDDERPGTMMDGYTAWTVVVSVHPLLDVAGDAGVVTVRVGVAAEDVDEAPVAHAEDNA